MNEYFDNASVGRPTADSVSGYINHIFSLMALGLGITALLSFITLNCQPMLVFTVKTYWLFVIGELGIVFYLSARVFKMDSKIALMWFIFYSALNGITLTPIFLVYTHSAVASAFFVSAGMFGAMTLWGYVTKKDLTSLGGLMTMGLFGIIIASVVNLFLQNTGMQLIISYASVGIFIGLTAWDVQKLKRLALSGQMTGGIAVMGALQLYLDFINIFISILNILGGRRD